MRPNPQDDPPRASDPDVAASVEAWLNDKGWAWSYGPGSVRIERGDPVLFSLSPYESTSKDL
jgi:hypothetical protein